MGNMTVPVERYQELLTLALAMQLALRLELTGDPKFPTVVNGAQDDFAKWLTEQTDDPSSEE